MVKVLFSGDIRQLEEWGLLVNRLKELQVSSHGPFHILFICGKVVAPSIEHIHQLGEIDIKLYSFNVPSLAPDQVEAFGAVVETLPMKKAGIISAASNLTVAFYREAFQSSAANDADSVQQIVSSIGYRGCDILISSDWPADAYQFLEANEIANYQALGMPMGGSRNISEFAVMVRPRYHFVSGQESFYQRTPYVNISTDSKQRTTPQPRLYSRLISLASASESKDKTKKWLHALSLNPIIVMKAAEIEEAPAVFTECPFVTTGKRTHAVMTSSSTVDTGSDHASKRFKALSAEAEQQGPGSYFFGDASQHGKPLNLVPPSTTATTLFIGGISPESNEHDLGKFMRNIRSIRRTPGKRFAFVDFVSHSAACDVVDQSTRRPFRLDGRTLQVGWGNSGGNDSKHNEQRREKTDEEKFAQLMNERQLVPPSEDARVLYIGNLANVTEGNASLLEDLQTIFEGVEEVQVVPGKSFAFVQFINFNYAMAVITRSLNENIKLQGRPLIIGWSKSGGSSSKSSLLMEPPYPDCKVLFLGNVGELTSVAEITAALSQSVPLLGQANGDSSQGEAGIVSIRKPSGRNYAFVEFDSNAAAATMLERITEGAVKLAGNSSGHALSAGWAKGRAAEQEDQCADCWFCLASPSVKVHLIASVGECAYVALPRGGIVDYHTMVCPIDCVPSRLHLSTQSKQEVLRYVRALEKCCAQQRGELLITYERAIRTKGSRDHMQVHCLPVDQQFANRIPEVFAQKVSEHGYNFHEIPVRHRFVPSIFSSVYIFHLPLISCRMKSH